MDVADRVVYKATNRANGKVYIGISRKGLAARKAQHEGCALRIAAGKESRVPYQVIDRAIAKHGISMFDWETIHNNVSSDRELSRLEIHYIEYYRSMDPAFGYNVHPGGLRQDVPPRSFPKVYCVTSQTLYNDVIDAVTATNKGTGAARLHEACTGRRSTFLNAVWQYRF